MKACTVCGVTKPLGEFGIRVAMKDGRRSECKPCMAADSRVRRASLTADERSAKWKAEYDRNREKKLAAAKAYNRANKDRVRESAKRSRRLGNWTLGLVTALRGRAKRYGYAFELTPEILQSKFESQKGLCYWFGVPMVPSVDHRGPWRPSVDRIDNSLGYTEANTVLTCMFANMGRSALSAERMLMFVNELRGLFRVSS